MGSPFFIDYLDRDPFLSCNYHAAEMEISNASAINAPIYPRLSISPSQ
jgi:hypothetical protein